MERPSTIDSFVEMAMTFSEADRFEIAERLLDSIPDSGIPSMDDPGYMEEVQRRASEPFEGIPWKEIYEKG